LKIKVKDNVPESLDQNDYSSIVKSFFNTKKSGFELNSNDSQIYYKVRHNLFQTFINFNLGIPNLGDTEFLKFNVNSRKTPDVLHYDFVKNTFYILEYTVTKKFESAFVNKKGFTKYDEEVEILRSRGHEIVYEYIFIVLEDNADSCFDKLKRVANSLEVDLELSVKNDLDQLILYINECEWDIKCWMPELLYMNFETINIEVKNSIDIYHKEFRLEKIGHGMKNLKEERIMSYIFNFQNKLLSICKRKNRNSNLKILIDLHKRNVNVIENDNGLNKVSLISLITILSRDILEYVTTTKTDEEEPLFFDSKETIICEDEGRELRYINKFDDSYIISKLNKEFSNCKIKTLADNDLSDQFEIVPQKYLKYVNKLYYDDNKLRDNVILKIKNPFIFPPCINKNGKPEIFKTGDRIFDKLVYDNKKFIDFYDSTEAINREVDFEKIDKINIEINNLNSKINEFGFDVYRKLKKVPFKKLRDMDIDPLLKKLIIDMRSKSSEYSKCIHIHGQKVKNKISVSKEFLKDFKDTCLFNLSKDHTKYEVTPLVSDPNGLDKSGNLINNFYKSLFLNIDVDIDNPISKSNPTGKGLKNICEDMKNLVVNSFETHLSKTILFSTLTLWSRISYSLMYHSMTSSSKQHFFIENCGSQNIILIVKGGKKILSTKNSRFFTILIETNEESTKLVYGSSTKIIRYNNKLYMLYPWRQLRIEYLKNFIELPYKFSSYFLGSFLESNLDFENYKNFIMTKVLLMFSQKRKMESWSGNFRYIYFNSFGTHTYVLELIKNMAIYESDILQFFLQRSFVKNYKDLYLCAKEGKLLDISSSTFVENQDLCAEKFDEHIFMTKAPFNPLNEYLKNVRSVLNIHKEFLDNTGSLDHKDIHKKTAIDIYEDDVIEKSFKNDFNFCPDLCFAIGNYASDYLSEITNKQELTEKFNFIISKSFNEVATSKGMRFEDGSFWGYKGHTALAEFLKDKKPKIFELLRDNLNDPSSYEKFIRDNNINYKDVIEEINSGLSFDLDSKKQYKGSRETYTMEMKTKIRQQPLEQFFKFLCTKTPNELIHKRSNIRPKFIHSKIFEGKGDGEMLYATLDCSKWAPKSNLYKYLYFILGMRNILPENFINYFMDIWSLMFNKRLYFKPGIKNRLLKNKNTIDIAELLEIDEEKTNNRLNLLKIKLNKKNKVLTDEDIEKCKIHYIKMPYSFMMGIYNYLSSFFHAISQNYFADKIIKQRGIDFHLMAHSDDSGGVVIGRDYKSCVLSMKYYEYFQKLLNHLISRKKSSLSRDSFEIISIMYRKKRFIPMTHKFFSNINLQIGGVGWYEDISNVISKVIEVHSNGATMLQCYIVQLIFSEMYRRIYHLPNSEHLSNVPLSFGGIYLGHPMHIIFLGTNCQEKMLDLLESKEEKEYRIYLYKSLSNYYIRGKGAELKFKLPYYIRNTERLMLSEEEDSVLNAYSKLPYKDTLSHLIRYYNTLKNNKFIYSLNGIDSDALMLCTMFYNCDVLMENKSIKLKTLTEMYLSKYILLNNEDKIEELDWKIPDSFDLYIKNSESINYKLEDINIDSVRTCKPITYTTINIMNLKINYKQVSEVLAVLNNEKIKNIFHKPEKIEVIKRWLLENIQGYEESEKIDMLNYITRNDFESSRSVYLYMPSGVSTDTSERFFTYNILYNTRRYKISKNKPQYYTAENFDHLSFQSLSIRHMYLNLRLIYDNINTKNFDKILELTIKNINNCPTCLSSNKKTFNNIITNDINIPMFKEVNLDIPFAIYNKKQIRGKTVWYGSSDFEIHDNGYSIIHRVYGSEIRVKFIIEDENYLKFAYLIYSIFCDSRGIMTSSIARELTPLSLKRLCFSDSWTPYISYGDSYEMALENSEIEFKDSLNPFVEKTDRFKYSYDGYNIDLNILNVNSISPEFFKKHNIKDINNILFTETFKIEKDVLLENFSLSKLNKVIFCDENQTIIKDFNRRLEHKQLLGSELSFTRSLYEATKLGITDYRNSANPEIESKNSLESIAIQDLPVLDLLPYLNLSRVNTDEIEALNKIYNNKPIFQKDKNALYRLKNKIGISGSHSGLVLASKNMKIYNTKQLFKMNKDYINQMLPTIFEALNDIKILPKQNYYIDCNEKKFWDLLFLKSHHTIEKKLKDFCINIYKGIMHMKKYNPEILFNHFKNNFILLMLCWEENSSVNCINILMYLINNAIVTKELENILNNIRSYNVSKLRIIKDQKNYKNSTSLNEDILHDVRLYGTIKPISFNKNLLEDFSDMLEELRDEDYEFDSLDYEIEDRYWLEDNEENRNLMENLGFLKDSDNLYYYNCYTETSISNLLMMCSSNVMNFYINTDIDFNIPFLGAYDKSKFDLGDIIVNRIYFPGNNLTPLYSKYMVRSREIKIDPTKDISTKEISELIEGFKVQTGIDISDENENKIMRDKIKNKLKNLDIRNQKIHKMFLQQYDESLETKINMSLDYFKLEKANFKLDDIINKFIKPRDIKSHLPGYNNILIDSKLKSELISIFGNNMSYIVSGQVKCSKSMRDMFIMNIRSLWHSIDKNKRYVLNFICSILKEVILSNNNDDWFINSISEILNKFNKDLNRKLDELDYSLEAPNISVSIDYGEAQYEYDDYDFNI